MIIKHIRKGLVFALLLQALFSFSQPVQITGQAPGYGGRKIVFYTFTDPVSKNNREVFALQITNEGEIKATAEVKEATWCFADFDVYRGKLMLMPGQDIKLKFPPFRAKSFEETKNPYFKPIDFWLNTTGSATGELTALFSRFDNELFRLTDRYFVPLYQYQQRNYLDTLNRALGQAMRAGNRPEYTTHYTLRLQAINADLSRAGREKLFARVAPSDPAFWCHPAFIELMERLFTNTLANESKTTAGSRLRGLVAQRNYEELKKWVENYSATTSPLSELILVKTLHDAFYSGQFSKPAILHLLQHNSLTNHSVEMIRRTAAETYTKIAFLYPATKAPVIRLNDLSGRITTSAGNKLPFLYVMFADPDIPVCLEQIKYLKTMSEKTGDKLGILLVLTPTDRIDLGDFLKSNEIPGQVVIDTETRETGKRFNIRSYPTAILLDAEHKVVLAPARTPLDGFEHQFAGLKK